MSDRTLRVGQFVAFALVIVIFVVDVIGRDRGVAWLAVPNTVLPIAAVIALGIGGERGRRRRARN
jgi:hypothetical protein